MKNLLAIFLLMFYLASFSGCASIMEAVKVVDEKTDVILTLWDNQRGLYSDIKKYAIDNKEKFADIWDELVAMDTELKKMDAVMKEIKSLKEMSKEQAANIKATTEGMADLVKLGIALL